MGKKKEKSRSKLNKQEITKQVRDYLAAHSDSPVGLRQIFKALKLTNHPLKMLCVDILNEMIDAEEIGRNSDGEIVSGIHGGQTAEGVYHRTSGGRNFVDTDDGKGISIYDEDLHNAIPGDRVRVSLFASRREKNKLRGEIIEVIERSEKPYVGELQMHGDMAYLLVSGTSMLRDIAIPGNKLKGGKNGEKVVVRVTDWPMGSRNPIGEVIDVLGKSGENNTEMHAILAEFGLPYKYPEEVEAYANRLEPGITPEEIARREDFRDVTTYTIDPRDAKDFDDAISIRPISEGLWEVGVHIADVSHYVLEGSVIDKEAQKRATSIYLVYRTIPMLPERLCNFICSLRPNEEKLAYSVIFELNEDAEVRKFRIAHTVIKSNRRFTYEEVQHLLEEQGEATECQLIFDGKARPTEPIPAAEMEGKESEPVSQEDTKMLITLNRLAKKLRADRFKHGAINFDREEVRFEIDETGKPTSVYFKQAKDANKLVEEFMLLANRTVAESVGKVKKGAEKPKTLPYRIHDMPDPNKLENLSQFVARFGLFLQTQGTKTAVAKSLNKLLADVKGQKTQELVENVSLRAMMKARYSTDNIGHYGLAFDYYTHFTSPIRRYPDLMVHRLLTRYAEGAKSASQVKYEALCEHSSDMEQIASNAERASIKYKQVEFMADKIGEEFDARISGVTEHGIYAEIEENKCEGLISVRYLGEEPFDFDDRNYCLVGRKTHHKFSLGDPIRIKVARANLMEKQLDFEFVRKLTTDSSDNNSKSFKQFIELTMSKRSKAGGKTKKSKKKRK